MSFLLIWSFGFINLAANKTTATLGLIFTVVGTYFLQKEFNFEFSLIDKLIILFFPFLYLVMFTFLHGSISLIYLINPFLIGFILLVLILNQLKYLLTPRNIFIFSFIILFYTFALYPEWKLNQYSKIKETENFDDNTQQKTKPKETVNDSLNLFNFSFINQNLDTSIISSKKDFILIETWNETCVPCIKAFKEMPPFYQSQKDKLAVFYLYEHHKESVRKKFDKIFNFKVIKEKSKIIIDIDQKFYINSKMNGYPYFLLFDKHGKLVFSQKGYSSDYREKFESEILEILEK